MHAYVHVCVLACMSAPVWYVSECILQTLSAGERPSKLLLIKADVHKPCFRQFSHFYWAIVDIVLL